MAQALVQQRCANHANREAAARCPECRNFYCRECVVEHEDRYICAACLRKLTEPKKAAVRLRLGPLVVLLQGIAGLLMLWFAFYFLARLLIWMPNAANNVALWKTLSQ